MSPVSPLSLIGVLLDGSRRCASLSLLEGFWVVWSRLKGKNENNRTTSKGKQYTGALGCSTVGADRRSAKCHTTTYPQENNTKRKWTGSWQVRVMFRVVLARGSGAVICVVSNALKTRKNKGPKVDKFCFNSDSRDPSLILRWIKKSTLEWKGSRQTMFCNFATRKVRTCPSLHVCVFYTSTENQTESIPKEEKNFIIISWTLSWTTGARWLFLCSSEKHTCLRKFVQKQRASLHSKSVWHFLSVMKNSHALHDRERKYPCFEQATVDFVAVVDSGSIAPMTSFQRPWMIIRSHISHRNCGVQNVDAPEKSSHFCATSSNNMSHIRAAFFDLHWNDRLIIFRRKLLRVTQPLENKTKALNEWFDELLALKGGARTSNTQSHTLEACKHSIHTPGFSTTLRNCDLFLTHPRNWNKRVCSKYAHHTFWRWFGVSQVTDDVAKQSNLGGDVLWVVSFASRVSQALVHFVAALARVLTDHNMSGLHKVSIRQRSASTLQQVHRLSRNSWGFSWWSPMQGVSFHLLMLRNVSTCWLIHNVSYRIYKHLHPCLQLCLREVLGRARSTCGGTSPSMIPSELQLCFVALCLRLLSCLRVNGCFCFRLLHRLFDCLGRLYRTNAHPFLQCGLRDNVL